MRDARRWAVLALLCAALSVAMALAAGCGERGGAGSGNGDGDGSGGEIELEFWTLALSPFFDDYVADMIADFEAAHPGVAVRWVDVPFTAMDRRLVTAAAAGRAPDVVNLSDKDFARFTALGAMAALGPAVERIAGRPADEIYLASAVAPLRIDGRLLALPWYVTTGIRFANTELLAQGGLSVDTLAGDWATLREQARAYHAATGRFLTSVPLGVDSALPVMLFQQGLVPFREDEAGALRADLAKPEVVAFVTPWVDLYREGALPRSAATSNFQAVIDDYQRGRVAVMETGVNMYARVKDAAPEIAKATALLPALTGRSGRGHIALMTLGVLSTSERPELATALALHVTSAANQLALARRSSVMPSTTASLNDPFFHGEAGDDQTGQAEDPAVARGRAIVAASLKTATAYTPALPAWPEMRRAFSAGIQPALLDGKPVEDCLREIEAAWDRLLDAGLPARMDALPFTDLPPVSATPGAGDDATHPDDMDPNSAERNTRDRHAAGRVSLPGVVARKGGAG